MILCANPAAQFHSYQDEIEAAVLKVLRSNRYILGEEVEALEGEFADYIGAHSAIGVANGTDALEIAIRALDIGPGDEVITVSHTAVATVAASDWTDLHYKVSRNYDAHDEGGLFWNDPDVSIQWPLSEPAVTLRDTNYPQLKDLSRGQLPHDPFILGK